MGAYAFEAKAPFRITRSTTIPLLHGSKNDPRVYEFPLVIFPGGSLFDEEKQEHLVVFGVNDCRSGWIKIPHDDLLSLMRVYVQKKDDPNTSVAKNGNRLYPITRVEDIGEANDRHKELVQKPDDAGACGTPEKRVSKTTNPSPAKRRRKRATKARVN